ncbi:MAG: hypothetical protein RR816_14650 [Clostridia bacterium]
MGFIAERNGLEGSALHLIQSFHQATMEHIIASQIYCGECGRLYGSKADGTEKEMRSKNNHFQMSIFPFPCILVGECAFKKAARPAERRTRN